MKKKLILFKNPILILFFFIVLLLVSICSISCSNNKTEEVKNTPEPAFDSSKQVNKQLKNIVVLGTGGTIAGVAEEGKDTGYKPGEISADDLIKSVPEIKKVANINTIQLFNVVSDNISMKDMTVIANKINELDKDNSVDGIVVTHGTDTMEETAYFLNLVCKTDKPVVVTGAMRPATSLSADGPMNLYHAIMIAVSDEAKNMPVMVSMNEKIISARWVQKSSTSDLNALQGGDLGVIGFVKGENVVFVQKELGVKYKNSSDFSVCDVNKLPNVCVIYFHVDADIELLKYTLNKYDGIVIAGAGEGSFNTNWKEVIDNSKKPIVLSTRTNSGIVLKEDTPVEYGIPASYLTPQKAAILLRVVLWNNKNLNNEEFDNIFNTY